METTLKKIGLFLTIISLCIINSCQKDSPKPPDVLTGEVTNLQTGSYTLNGKVNANGSMTTVTFEYGETVAYGEEEWAPQNLVTGTNKVNVTAEISGLMPFKTYHYRVVAENEVGISYGKDKTFTVDCTTCLTVMYQNGVIISQGAESAFCGTALQNILNSPPVYIGTTSSRWECGMNNYLLWRRMVFVSTNLLERPIYVVNMYSWMS